MAGAPGLEEIERLGAAHFANRNPVRAKAKAGTDQIRERGNAILGPHRHKVWGAALELAGVFDQNNPVCGLGDLSEQGVCKRRFAGASAPSDKDVQPLCNARTKPVGFSCAHDSCADIVLEQEHRDGGLADGKGGSRHHGWQEAFEPFSAFRQLR